jgi:hypothetical protein
MSLSNGKLFDVLGLVLPISHRLEFLAWANLWERLNGVRCGFHKS